MGSSTILDIIGSVVVAGTLLLVGLRLNASANETSAVYLGNYILQTDITALVQLLESDFSKIGYCREWQKIPEPSKSIRIAEANRIRFWADIENKGTVDSLTYYLGSPAELTATPNPHDRYLYRQMNNAQPLRVGRVTQFLLEYFDAENDPLVFPITEPRKVYYMQMTIKIESPEPHEQQSLNDSTQYEVCWKQLRLVTKNLKNR